ncbi:MarR family transcriptional regulator [Paraburkholderia silviterrae]|uniref:Uncharacterized protein n=1 Tax=Paraburkholderia silviterrae TaxID=2528715 RepID=A0A4R5MGJ8_9BURK|nr:hypothetical protein [Paraburkholderia silviterrae]TDG25880.1 hypothetical protein EYW47_00475 [Paraburkholderia silviterrae]
MGAPKWTEEELAIAKMIHESDKTVKELAHLLPGRPFYGIKYMVSSVGNGIKKRGNTSVAISIALLELEKNPGQTIAELAEKTGFNQDHLSRLIRRHHGKGLYVSSWRVHLGHKIERWSIGDLPDAPKPARQSLDEKRRKDRTRWEIWSARRNPFDGIVKQLNGRVHEPTGPTGRVFKQDMTGESLEDRRKAA